MKFAAYIFMAIIAVLTMQPIFSSSQTMTETQCCSKESCHKSKKQKRERKDCGDNGCNPFMACSFGNFYFLEKSFALLVPQTSLKREFIADNDNRLSTKIAECWHPPESI